MSVQPVAVTGIGLVKFDEPKKYFTVNDGTNPVSVAILMRIARMIRQRSDYTRTVTFLRSPEEAAAFVTPDMIAVFDGPRYETSKWFHPDLSKRISDHDKPAWVGKADWAVQVNPSGIAKVPRQSTADPLEVYKKRLFKIARRIHQMFATFPARSLQGQLPWGANKGTKQPRKEDSPKLAIKDRPQRLTRSGLSPIRSGTIRMKSDGFGMEPEPVIRVT